MQWMKIIVSTRYYKDLSTMGLNFTRGRLYKMGAFVLKREEEGDSRDSSGKWQNVYSVADNITAKKSRLKCQSIYFLLKDLQY